MKIVFVSVLVFLSTFVSMKLFAEDLSAKQIKKLLHAPDQVFMANPSAGGTIYCGDWRPAPSGAFYDSCGNRFSGRRHRQTPPGWESRLRRAVRDRYLGRLLYR